MAELVDAPDSKSTDFGGVGIVYSIFTSVHEKLSTIKLLLQRAYNAFQIQKMRNMVYIERGKFNKVASFQVHFKSKR